MLSEVVSRVNSTSFGYSEPLLYLTSSVPCFGLLGFRDCGLIVLFRLLGFRDWGLVAVYCLES